MLIPKLLCLSLSAGILLGLAAGARGADPAAGAPWVPDRGDGTYKNPVLFADYSDPDAVRVGDDFYLSRRASLRPRVCRSSTPRISSTGRSSTTSSPRSRRRSTSRCPATGRACGRGDTLSRRKFWITYPDPDFGIYLTTATDPAGAWTPPVLIKAGKGLIDPCPFWDDDGRLYLIHGWAKSRAGIANLLTLHQLSPDGTKVLDPGGYHRTVTRSPTGQRWRARSSTSVTATTTSSPLRAA